MPPVTHLRSLQALELAARLGSLKAVADTLGITPAAVGQRIRTIEDFLGTELLLRGRSGLQPTAELKAALPDLRAAFAALDRATDCLDFQRTTEIHIVADTDWADLWLLPRLTRFRADNPNILFCVNGEGDVPMRIGAADIRVGYGRDAKGEDLIRDILVPVGSPDNLPRLGGFDREEAMEGLPLLHVKPHLDDPERPGWMEWFEKFGHRKTGRDRGVFYRNLQLAIEAMLDDVGFLVSGFALVHPYLESGQAGPLFPPEEYLEMPSGYRLDVQEPAKKRPQLRKFVEWLRAEAAETQRQIDAHKAGVSG